MIFIVYPQCLLAKLAQGHLLHAGVCRRIQLCIDRFLCLFHETDVQAISLVMLQRQRKSHRGKNYDEACDDKGGTLVRISNDQSEARRASEQEKIG